MKFKLGTRFLSVFLVLVLVFQLLPVSIFATDTDPVDLTEQAAEPLAVEGEVTSLRTESEKHYRLTDGSYIAVDYGMSVHYAAEDGSWEDIDNSLVATAGLSEEDESTYSAVNGDEAKAFAATFTPDSYLFSSQVEDYGVSMSLLQPTTAGQMLNGDAVADQSIAAQPFSSAEAIVLNSTYEASAYAAEPDNTDSITDQVQLPNLGSTVVYPDVLPGVDLQYDVVGRDIKESIIVNQAQTSYIYSFRLELADLTPAMQEDGSILLNNAAGQAIYQIPSPYMVDSAGNISQSVTYTLDETADGFILTVTADDAWINAEDRVLPVTIDPALIVVTGKLQESIYTTFVNQRYPSQSQYGSNMYMGYNGTYAYHGYMYFSELPTIPANCSVTGATISLYKMWYDYIGIEEFYGRIHPVTADIAALAGSTPLDDYLAGLTWNSAPAYGEVEDYASIVPTGASGKYITWDIGRSVTNWYTTGRAADRFMAITPWYTSTISSSNYASAAFYTFTNTTSHMPLFIVYYRNDVGLEGRFTYQNVSAGRAGGGAIGDYTSQMTWGNTLVTDASNTLPFSLTLYYNTANKDTDFVNSTTYGIHTANYTNMRTGLGWKLSVQESIQEITVQNTVGSVTTSLTYYVYHDADGTEHYFKKTDTSPYKDDEGMGLTLAVSGSTYTLEDQSDNKKTFYNGYLLSLTDANGNALYYCYNGGAYSATGTGWKPTSSGTNRVTSVVRVNNVGSKTPENVCTLAYNGNYLVSVTDASSRTTNLYYNSTASTGRQLTSITFPDNATAQYAYTSHKGLYRAYDAEAQYGLEFGYRTFLGRYCVQKVKEYTATAIDGTQTVGNAWHSWVFSKNQKEYRFYGNDQTSDTNDDIVTRYTFDYLGRTVNAVNLNAEKTLILGIADSAYTLNNGTSSKNNRLTGAATMGSAAVNLLNNSGFERGTDLSDDTSRYAWTAATSGSGTAVSVVPGSTSGSARTGNNRLMLGYPASLVSDSATAYASAYQKVYLTAGTAYTFSGYVDTTEITGFGKDGGVSLQFTTTSGSQLASSRLADFVTNNDIAQGWTRLEVSYIPTTTGWYRVRVVLRNAAGNAYVDDLQLEGQEAWNTDPDQQQCVGASSYNLLQIGSFELWNGTTADKGQDSAYWTYDAGKAVPSTDGAYEGYSMYIPGSLANTRRASQTVPLNCSGSTTFVLSAWGKATAAPDDKPDQEMTGDNSGKKRFFGLIATLTYDDGTKEYHYVTFDSLYTDWQYTSGFIAPKKPDQTITSITVSTAYDYNVNIARFDNISLTQEPVQTYTYDDEGHLKTVVDAATGQESYTYDGANLTKYVSSGSGTFDYEYDSHNNLTKATNDGVSVTANYDGAGNTTGTTLRKGSTGPYLQTSAEYTPDGNYVKKVTDVNGTVANYSYSAIGLPTKTSLVTDASTGEVITTRRTYVANTNRLYGTYIENWAFVANEYTKGRVSAIIRKSFPVGGVNQAPAWQRYTTVNDPWGNITQIRVQGSNSTSDSVPTSWNSGVVLGNYTYSGENGELEKMEYGNGAYVTYEYDLYGRKTRVKYWDTSDTLTSQERYYYDGNGNVSRKEHLNGTGVLLEAYTYEYDSLGRLIRTQADDANRMKLQTEHIYDAQNRLSSQSYFIGGVDFTQSFTYNNSNGCLSQMTACNGDTISYSYDETRRLSSVTAAGSGGTTIYTRSYTYTPHINGGSQSTDRVAKVEYSLPNWTTDFHYTYDALGDIVSYREGTGNTTTYAYDKLGQLTTMIENGSATSYNYDTAGNIRSITKNGTVISSYSYDNNNWHDLLTGYNGEVIAYEGQQYNANSNSVSGSVASGNPISYFNGTRWGFAWENGRQLVTATMSTDDNTELSIAYTYDLNGLRTSKTVTTQTYAITQHTVTFVADGVTVKTMAVDDGYVLKNSDYPTVPEKSGYIGSWNKYTSPVTNDLTIQASYRLPLRCTVTFKANNVVLKTMTVDEGYMLKLTDYPSIPPQAQLQRYVAVAHQSHYHEHHHHGGLRSQGWFGDPNSDGSAGCGCCFRR